MDFLFSGTANCVMNHFIDTEIRSLFSHVLELHDGNVSGKILKRSHLHVRFFPLRVEWSGILNSEWPLGRSITGAIRLSLSMMQILKSTSVAVGSNATVTSQVVIIPVSEVLQLNHCDITSKVKESRNVSREIKHFR